MATLQDHHNLVNAAYDRVEAAEDEIKAARLLVRGAEARLKEAQADLAVARVNAGRFTGGGCARCGEPFNAPQHMGVAEEGTEFHDFTDVRED